MIVALVEAELTEVLGAWSNGRAGKRCGYRHGHKTRALTTGLRQTQLTIPGVQLCRDGQAMAARA